MTQLFAALVIGTVSTTLALLLLALRLQYQGRRPFLALTRRWVAAGSRKALVIVAVLVTIALASFAFIADGVSTPATLKTTANEGDADLVSLRAYANEVGTSSTSAAQSAQLPGVDAMIDKLAARLKAEPNDVRGWKMLGWSYLNTDRPAEAIKAYETALKLAPDDSEIAAALDQARQLVAAPATSAAAPGGSGDTRAGPGAAPGPTPQDIAAAGALSQEQRATMIRGMVEQLAARLATAPNDEEGWKRLLRARMVLGEPSVAQADLAKALTAFANDPAAASRLRSAARELGISGN